MFPHATTPAGVGAAGPRVRMAETMHLINEASSHEGSDTKRGAAHSRRAVVVSRETDPSAAGMAGAVGTVGTAAGAEGTVRGGPTMDELDDQRNTAV